MLRRVELPNPQTVPVAEVGVAVEDQLRELVLGDHHLPREPNSLALRHRLKELHDVRRDTLGSHLSFEFLPVHSRLFSECLLELRSDLESLAPSHPGHRIDLHLDARLQGLTGMTTL